ncbi:MAG: porin [Proteobacteria bacterium]|nr:porin [Pseudomonadota bacterium]
MRRTDHKIGVRALLLIILGLVSLVAQASGPSADLTSLEDDNGLLLHSSSDASLWLDARLGITAGGFSGSANHLEAGIELRRARLGVKTIFASDWAAELDLDVMDREVELKDAWVAWSGWPNTILTLGNQKVPTGLEQLETSRWITFIERALPDQLISDRRLGATARRWSQRWQTAVGVFGEEPGDGAEDGDKEGWGAVARITTNQPVGTNGLLHLGVSGSRFTPDGGRDRVRFRQRPEIQLTERLLHTGWIRQAEATRLLGIEGAVRFGSISVQAEYLRSRVDRTPGLSNVDFSGWYGYVSWMFNGGRRSYFADSGEFGYPHLPTGKGGLELAARYSTLDLNDPGAGVFGGAGTNVTIGINWYPNRQVKFSANLIGVSNDAFADSNGDLLGNDDFVALMGLVQVAL